MEEKKVRYEYMSERQDVSHREDAGLRINDMSRNGWEFTFAFSVPNRSDSAIFIYRKEIED